MFEITRIRIRRLTRTIIYGLAIYGGMCAIRGCQNESYSKEIGKASGSSIEYNINIPVKDGKEPVSFLEKRIQDLYVR